MKLELNYNTKKKKKSTLWGEGSVATGSNLLAIQDTFCWQINRGMVLGITSVSNIF